MITFFGLLVNCFDVYILTLIASRFCEKRWSGKIGEVLFITVLGSLMTASAVFMANKGVSVTATMIVIVVCINVLYTKRLGIILAFITYFAIISICELISVNTISLVTGSDATDVALNNNIFSVIFVAFTKILEYIIVFFLFKKFQDDLAKSFRMYRMIFYFSTAIILLNAAILYIFIIMDISLSNWFIIYFSVSIIIYFLLILYLIYKLETIARDNERQAIINLENQMTKEHSEKIEIMVERFHQLNHDYRFHMQTLKELLDRHLYDYANDYFQEIVHSFENSTNGFIDNHPVISILLMKMVKQASEENIIFKCDMPKRFEIEISDSDLNIILSNLLENAFQAVKKLVGEKRWVKLGVVNRPDNFMLIIENPYQNQIVKEGRFIKTTKDDAANHGYGLKSINNILEKYRGFIDIESSNGIFSVTLIFSK